MNSSQDRNTNTFFENLKNRTVFFIASFCSCIWVYFSGVYPCVYLLSTVDKTRETQLIADQDKAKKT